jgi:tRNA (cytidine32/uridine32-2'-O)-methyltransferase
VTDDPTQCLDRIRIVLVDTSHPGNIGAVARAMKTMCLSQLVLVSPKLFPHADATARASGADDILASAQVVDSLDKALLGCQLVIGASARLRRLGWPQLGPAQSAMQAVSEAKQGHVAYVFGREDSGLSNEELERCHYLMHIDTNPEFSSLNLGSAVQLVCYEIQRHYCLILAETAPENRTNYANELVAQGKSQQENNAEHDVEEYANSEQMEHYYKHFESVLMDIGFLDPHHPRKMMRRLKRLFNRSRLSLVELNIMRGILSGIEKFKHKGG